SNPASAGGGACERPKQLDFPSSPSLAQGTSFVAVLGPTTRHLRPRWRPPSCVAWRTPLGGRPALRNARRGKRVNAFATPNKLTPNNIETDHDLWYTSVRDVGECHPSVWRAADSRPAAVQACFGAQGRTYLRRPRSAANLDRCPGHGRLALFNRVRRV